jgi:hypothetical protein
MREIRNIERGHFCPANTGHLTGACFGVAQQREKPKAVCRPRRFAQEI